VAYLAYLQSEPLAALAVFVAMGLVAGSFLNVVVHRLPRMLERDWREQAEALKAEPPSAPPAPVGYNLVRPGSTCPQCGAPVRAWQNVPILSYLAQRGRCRSCRAPIPWRYPVIEAAAAAFAAAAMWRFGIGAQALAAALLSWSLLALSAIDIQTRYLPDDITLPMLWLGLLLNIHGVFTDLASAVLGAVIGYLTHWGVYQLFKLLTGKEGMGYGDFKLLAMLGAWLGWQNLPLIIILSAFVGAAVGVTMVVMGRQSRQTQIPFGPYLAGAGWLSLLWGPQLTGAYLRWAF
jgi:leader peptidase (prepilin peptidase)/N-methyltransferase